MRKEDKHDAIHGIKKEDLWIQVNKSLQNKKL